MVRQDGPKDLETTVAANGEGASAKQKNVHKAIVACIRGIKERESLVKEGGVVEKMTVGEVVKMRGTQKGKVD